MDRKHLVAKTVIAFLVPIVLGIIIDMTPNLQSPESVIMQVIVVSIIVMILSTLYDQLVLKKGRKSEERLVEIEHELKDMKKKVQSMSTVLEFKNDRSIEELSQEAHLANNNYKERE